MCSNLRSRVIVSTNDIMWCKAMLRFSNYLSCWTRNHANKKMESCLSRDMILSCIYLRLAIAINLQQRKKFTLTKPNQEKNTENVTEFVSNWLTDTAKYNECQRRNDFAYSNLLAMEYLPLNITPSYEKYWNTEKIISFFIIWEQTNFIGSF